MQRIAVPKYSYFHDIRCHQNGIPSQDYQWKIKSFLIRIIRIIVYDLKYTYHCFTVQRGVDRVTAISNHEVEAPDYDSEGHMEPTFHREDIKEDDED